MILIFILIYLESKIIRNVFLCQKQLFYIKKWYKMKYFGLFFY